MSEQTKTPRTDACEGSGLEECAELTELCRQLETELADARAALRDVFASDGSEGIYDAVKLYAARERGRNFLAKQG